jgi:type I restriction enzyme S subunit
LYQKGTIFITARGTVGDLNIASKDMAMNQSCYAIAPKSDINYYYLHQCCIDIIQYLKAKVNGSIFDSIVSNDIKLTPICIPPLELIQCYGQTMESVYEKVLVNLKENQQLSSLRDWLLPMLMNGQVKVKSSSAVEDNYEITEGLNIAAEPQKTIR